MREQQYETLSIREEPVELYKLIKLAGIASGGEAKHMIGEGRVSLNGEQETRKRKKVYAGDRIVCDEWVLSIVLEETE